MPAPPPTPPEQRFWRYVNKTDGCWLWTGGNNGRYGVFTIDGRRAHTVKGYAHRFSYEMHHGPIPEGKNINHLCRTPLCVRPDHLEAVTHRENLLYSPTTVTAQKASQEVCKYGHPLDRRKPNGTRRCSTCGRDRQREARARKRGEDVPYRS